MGLGAIKKKGEALGKKSASSFLKINMYENPQMALDLIAHICTASKDIDVSDCFSPYEELAYEMNLKIKEQSFKDPQFLNNCYFAGQDLQEALLSDVSANLKIAVAGGYSAGKSSLLNALTGIENMLPTGIDPVSMVNTFINCSSTNSRLVVRGENIKSDIVLLNKDILSCVQHSSKSKVYVASVLNRIILDIPSTKELNGITFIDTPGYNNSSAIADGSVQTDSDKAMAAISKADAVFWCIDSEAGTITNSDVQMLKRIQSELEDTPVVIFFTKMDKKRPEIRKILKNAEAICKRELTNIPVDIIGISCVNHEVEYEALSKDSSWNSLIKKIRQDVGPTDYYQLRSHQLKVSIDDELAASSATADNYESNRQKSISDKNDLQKWYSDTKERNDELKQWIREMLVDSYDSIMDAAQRRIDAYDKAIDGWSKSLDREVEWSGKSGLFADTSWLSSRYSSAIDHFNRLVKQDLSYQYWEREDRENACNSINEAFDNNLKEISDYREAEEKNYQEQIQNKIQEEQLSAILREYKPKLLHVLKECYHKCKQRIEDHNACLQGIPVDADIDIFSAICGDNWKRFLACFSNGVDLTQCSSDGYNPITMACKMGNNEMVKFFVEHEVNLSLCDKRGYNALETAVINHYKDICEILIKADSSLIASSKPLVDLAKQNTFLDWVSNI